MGVSFLLFNLIIEQYCVIIEPYTVNNSHILTRERKTMLDLKVTNLAESAETGYEFELLLPETKDKTGGFVKVRGSQSPTVRNYGKRKYNEYQVRVQQAKRKGKEVDDLTLDEAEDLAVENATNRIISWRGIGEGGVELPFTKENADMVLRKHSWIREQVMEESDNQVNFQ